MTGRIRLAILILLCLAGLTGCTSRYYYGQRGTFDASDLAGIWQADYSQYDLAGTYAPRSGIEIITLRMDGTFQQSFSGTYISQCGDWWLESRWILHLAGARLFLYGAAGGAYTVDCEGNSVELDGTELLLCARLKPSAPGGIVLQHLTIGDPDAPKVIEFRRIANTMPTNAQAH